MLYALRLNTLPRLSSQGGGIILAGINGKIACDDITETESRQEKNEIFVEYATSTGVSAVAGYALAIFMISNPVGWTVALGLGAATAFGAIAAGKGAAKFYDTNLREYDLVSNLGVDQLCN